MTFNDTTKYAEAEIVLDNDHFGSNAVDSQVVLAAAQPVLATTPKLSTTTTKTYDSAKINYQDPSSPYYATQGTDRDADLVLHNVQHKRNVVIGVSSGVLLGLILLGPIAAVAGGFIGWRIVRRRERRWCRLQNRTTAAGPVFPAGKTAAGPVYPVVME
jgi:hypothetical protein